MALLSKDITLALPFPDKELTQLCRGDGDPFVRWIGSDAGDRGFGNTEGLELREFGKFIKGKDSRGEANREELCWGVEMSRCNLCVWLKEIVF